MALALEEIKKLIKESIPDATIEIKDLMGDNNHYAATIKSSKFNNLSKLDQWHYAPPLKGSWFTFPPSERFVRSFLQDRQK